LTILHAMLKHRTSWKAQEVQNEKIYEAPLTTKTVAPLVPRSGYSPRLKPGVRLPICTLARRLLACASMDFEIVGEITSIETFASGSGVRERARLRR